MGAREGDHVSPTSIYRKGAEARPETESSLAAAWRWEPIDADRQKGSSGVGEICFHWIMATANALSISELYTRNEWIL